MILRNRNHPSRGFTLIECIFLILIVFSLSFLALTKIKNGKLNSRALICLSNLRHLGIGWQMYADESNGDFLSNHYGEGWRSETKEALATNAPWAVGWMDWTSSSDNTNTMFLRSEPYAFLGRYLPPGKSVHKCPADDYISKVQQARGWKPRVRSVALNATIGSGNAPVRSVE